MWPPQLAEWGRAPSCLVAQSSPWTQRPLVGRCNNSVTKCQCPRTSLATGQRAKAISGSGWGKLDSTSWREEKWGLYLPLTYHTNTVWFFKNPINKSFYCHHPKPLCFVLAFSARLRAERGDDWLVSYYLNSLQWGLVVLKLATRLL